MRRTRISVKMLLLGALVGAPVCAWADKAPPPKAAEGGAIPGVDLSGMAEPDVKALRGLLEKLPSACGKPHSLLVSLRTDKKCKLAPLAVRTLQRFIKDGFLPSEIEERYNERYAKPKCAQIDTTGAFVRGDAKAPITIVEFSDFECPVCKMAEPMLKQVLEKNADVKLIFMNFPLPMHQNALPAATASLAAGKQGKFWAYHDKLFENQGRQSMADLLRYAQELGLNPARFQADMEGAKERVKRERAVGEKLELSGTPSLFINCHPYNDRRTPEALQAWIEEERVR